MYQAKYRARNKEMVKEKRHAEYLRNKDKVLAQGREWCSNNRDKKNMYSLRSHWKRMYGLSPLGYNMLGSQSGGVCGICGEAETYTRYGRVRRLSVDHDHKTGRVRGLLCSSCNAGLGMFKEDTTRLFAAIEWLNNNGSGKFIVGGKRCIKRLLKK
jgi:hypothetical protein